ncbi:hypothetical protein DNK56_04265 [Streptomyces sp. AC1-42W]|nr:hypothetical protein DNK56_04265 [Streptomyces sp. AC1-42W]
MAHPQRVGRLRVRRPQRHQRRPPGSERPLADRRGGRLQGRDLIGRSEDRAVREARDNIRRYTASIIIRLRHLAALLGSEPYRGTRSAVDLRAHIHEVTARPALAGKPMEAR